MSKAWAKGSTRAWRRIRAEVLARDGHRCRIQIEGVCTRHATHVHHTHGRAATGDDPRYLLSSCQPCNARVNDPATVSHHQRVVTWARANAPTTIPAIAAAHPDVTHSNVVTIVRRAKQRGELIRTERGIYDVGPTGLPPTGNDTRFSLKADPPTPAVPVHFSLPERRPAGWLGRLRPRLMGLTWAYVARFGWVRPVVWIDDTYRSLLL